jgi:hypothetical protein
MLYQHLTWRGQEGQDWTGLKKRVNKDRIEEERDEGQDRRREVKNNALTRRGQEKKKAIK